MILTCLPLEGSRERRVKILRSIRIDWVAGAVGAEGVVEDMAAGDNYW